MFSKFSVLIAVFAFAATAYADRKPIQVPAAYLQRSKLQLLRPELNPVTGASLQRDTSGRIRRLRGNFQGPGGRTAVEVAQAYLNQNEHLIQAKGAGTAALVPFRQAQSLTGTHVFFTQKISGYVIEGGQVSVHFDRFGKIRQVANDAIAIPQGFRFAPPANPARAIQAASALFARGRLKYQPQALPVAYSVQGRGLVSAWKVNIVMAQPSGDWQVVVDAASGQILKVLSLSQNAEGRAQVFNPDPVTTSNDFSLQDNNGANSPALERQLQTVTLSNLDGSGFLQGPYVTTAPTHTQPRTKESTLTFMYNRSDKRFDEVMVYYHFDKMQQYIQSLGFKNINNRQIAVDVNGQSDDNSHYSPLDKTVTFGLGGVHDAQDATIIYHEAGHAMQDNQVPGWGETTEGGAMGEGFGDYWAGSNFAQGNKFDVFVGKWDGVAYNPASGGNPAFLRRLDSTKHYPEDLQGEVHADGEIWSACLWQIRGILGREKADRLILEAHFHLTPQAVFQDGANALVQAAADLFGGSNQAAVKQVFTARGILK